MSDTLVLIALVATVFFGGFLGGYLGVTVAWWRIQSERRDRYP